MVEIWSCGDGGGGGGYFWCVLLCLSCSEGYCDVCSIVRDKHKIGPLLVNCVCLFILVKLGLGY